MGQQKGIDRILNNELPDIFKLNTGMGLSREDWSSRRKEFLEILLDIECGHLPLFTGDRGSVPITILILLFLMR
jgi:hypothetical protein